MNSLTETFTKKPRNFLPQDYKISTWENLLSYYQDLYDRKINSPEDLNKWMKNFSELESVIHEDNGWRYIRMSRDTTNKKHKENYTFFVSEIEPKIHAYTNKLNKKLLQSPFLKSFKDKKYQIYLRRVKKDVEIFREENIPLKTEESLIAKEYDAICGEMTIKLDGAEIPIIKATSKLNDTNRPVREQVFKKIHERRYKDVNKLDTLFSNLFNIRHKIAINAGFDNYRDYRIAELKRFDYSIQDCFSFHDSIKNEVLPIYDDLMQIRKETLGLDVLKPWDTTVNIFGKPPLNPYKNEEDFIDKTIQCFHSLRPYFAKCLQTMKNNNHLDLEARKGKAHGGYNYPLYESGTPFIFMNTSGTVKDITTMVHEGGHAVHSFLTNDLELIAFKSLTSEIAELASMSMELFSINKWNVFFHSEEELRIAKFQQLERVINIFPWVATIDKFQHWIYTHPEHSINERTQAWKDIYTEFSPKTIDWTGQEKAFATNWQRQLHVFMIPFYYIEYAIAQLGAIGMWKQFKNDPQIAMDNYIAALSLGYTKPIPEIYKTAGIKFDFSREYVRDLVRFVKAELDTLM